MDQIINISSVSKTFRLPHERVDTLKEHLLRFRRLKTYEDFHALQDVSMALNRGDFMGIVGKNGSGKSTLLKIIAGIYRPTSGLVHVKGTIAPFLELGIGFQPELTARENIRMNATLLGLTKQQIKSRFNDIVSFAEVENFLDLKMKNFSSGMRARLAFAIAREADADIYLCDEVLAVGDEGFQKKCLNVFNKWREEGKNVILVSHNAEQIASLCNRAILLDKGRIVADSDPHSVLEEYRNRLASEVKK